MDSRLIRLSMLIVNYAATGNVIDFIEGVNILRAVMFGSRDYP